MMHTKMQRHAKHACNIHSQFHSVMYNRGGEAHSATRIPLSRWRVDTLTQQPNLDPHRLTPVVHFGFPGNIGSNTVPPSFASLESIEPTSKCTRLVEHILVMKCEVCNNVLRSHVRTWIPNTNTNMRRDNVMLETQ